MKKLWIDIINPSHALFFNALLSELYEHQINVTVRDRAETVDLISSFGIDGQIIGTDYHNPLKKSINMICRTLNLVTKVPKFDVSLSFEQGMAVFASRMRLKPSILYRDNDKDLELSQGTFVKSIEAKIKARANYIIVPSVYDISSLIKEGAKKENIFQFDGYKEDVYIADYMPDSMFLNNLPFKKFIVIRPEALFAAYVKKRKSIVPELLASFVKEGVNIIYLPRIKEDIKHARGVDVFIPKKALNGLDLCYYADAVLTGSGTMAREAACMDATAVSFFPGKMLLSVDRQLVDEGRIFYSRDSMEIVDYVLANCKKNEKISLDRSKNVKVAVVEITKNLLDKIGDM